MNRSLAWCLSRGNSTTQTYNARQLSAYLWDLNQLSLQARFLRASAQDVENARNWNLGLKYEREVSKRWSGVIGQQVESDKFAGILQRYMSDAGSKFRIFKETSWQWNAEIGYRYTVENRLNGQQLNSNYARLYSEFSKEFVTGTSLKYWLEYLPNFTDSENYQFNTEISVSSMLNSIFSMKTGYLLRYNNAPPSGVQFRTDTVATTALVAKF
jgi:putative salt-induced outer membrane protein